MKELAVYFKKRMKDQEIIPKLWADRNYGEEVEYNIDHEIENRKLKLINCLNNIKNNEINYFTNQKFEKFYDSNFLNNNNIGENHLSENDENDENDKNEVSQAKLIEYELKLLKAYNFQKRLRRDVVMNFINEFDKHNTVYYSDALFHKALLDRRLYKKQIQNTLAKKETRLSDKFEQQLRVGMDFRKRDKHLEFLNTLMQHHKDFMEFHKSKRVRSLRLKLNEILHNY